MIDFSFKKGALVELLTNSHTFVGRIMEFPQYSTNPEYGYSGKLLIEPQLLVRKEGRLGTVSAQNAYHVDSEKVVAWRYIKAESLGSETNYISGTFIMFDDDGFSKKF